MSQIYDLGSYAVRFYDFGHTELRIYGTISFIPDSSVLRHSILRFPVRLSTYSLRNTAKRMYCEPVNVTSDKYAKRAQRKDRLTTTRCKKRTIYNEVEGWGVPRRKKWTNYCSLSKASLTQAERLRRVSLNTSNRPRSSATSSGSTTRRWVARRGRGAGRFDGAALDPPRLAKNKCAH
jgi:hypothetical protein